MFVSPSSAPRRLRPALPSACAASFAPFLAVGLAAAEPAGRAPAGPRPPATEGVPAVPSVSADAARPAAAADAPGDASTAVPGDAIDAAVAPYFRPYHHDHATLSPDGRWVALAEFVPSGPPAIVVFDPVTRAIRRFAVANSTEHAVRQLLWLSTTRLVFVTQGRAVGLVDLERPEIRPLLLGRDLEAYLPEPILGFRSMSAPATPDMPADPMMAGPADTGFRREMDIREALAQSAVSGDPFEHRGKADSGRTLRPFLLGPKPDDPRKVLVEVRGDGDLFGYRRADRRTFTVPGNVVLIDRNTPPPSSPADLGVQPSIPGQYASYAVDYPAPPLLVLELDVVSGRTRELVQEEDWRRVWIDRSGRPRLALEQKGRTFRYLHRGADTRKWVPLDAVAKATPGLGFAVDAAGLLGPRSVPLGFEATGRYLYVASNVGRDTFTLRALDLQEGKFAETEAGNERYDLIEPTALVSPDVLRFDPHHGGLAGLRYAAARRETRWFDPALAALQEKLQRDLAPQRAELLGWNAERSRFLVALATSSHPGSFHVLDTATAKLIPCGERAPWLGEDRRHPVREFDFVGAEGRRLAGRFTLPLRPRLDPPPVLVYFHDGPWYSDPPVFNRGAQALAALGFAVLQLNHRGSSGFGRNHLGVAGTTFDRAALADVQALLAHARGTGLAIHPRIVAALGNGFGGYLAVRMVQLAPDTFRCAVAMNAPGDLAGWMSHPQAAPSLLADLRGHVLGTDREQLRSQSALVAAAGTRAPVLVVHGELNTYVPVSLGRELHRALRAGSAETAYLELPGEGHVGWSEATTARLFAELGRFFNATIYAYKVDVRTPEIVR